MKAGKKPIRRYNHVRQAFTAQFPVQRLCGRLRGGVAPLAEQYAAVPGLRWKIWIINEAEGEAGGIYLFDDEESLMRCSTHRSRPRLPVIRPSVSSV